MDNGPCAEFFDADMHVALGSPETCSWSQAPLLKSRCGPTRIDYARESYADSWKGHNSTTTHFLDFDCFPLPTSQITA